jgi:DNA-binding NarL/FixJ family response regulator
MTWEATLISLLIVAQTRLFREGLCDMLGRESTYTVLGTASDAQSAIETALAHRPDVVLFDLAVTESWNAVQAIVRQLPDVHVVVLGLPDSEPELVRCAETGAAGYVSRDASFIELREILECAVRGELRCTPRAARVFLRRVAALAAGTASGGQAPTLTVRELEVARMIDAGLQNKEIARRLSIEVATVKNHVHNILDKLHVHRRSEAARRLRLFVNLSAPGSDASVPTPNSSPGLGQR